MTEKKSPQYPVPVHLIASSVDTLCYRHITGWQALAQSRIPPTDMEAMIVRQCMRDIAERFVEKAYTHTTVRTRDEKLGRVVEFEVVALRYDELLELLYRAYCEGQSRMRDALPPPTLAGNTEEHY